jgi:hypothetical protein
MFRSEKGATSYRLSFQKGYAFSLLNIKAKTMTWHSLASGDTFNCKREADQRVDIKRLWLSGPRIGGIRTGIKLKTKRNRK